MTEDVTEPGGDVTADTDGEATSSSSTEAEAPAEGATADPIAAAALQTQLAERTADLQRLQAEYVNYKKRVDRDRALMRAQGREDVLVSLLTVLDDVGRAEEHGELIGGFKAVADALQAAVTKHQLEKFGAAGEPFDPNQHEAVFHAGESVEVQTTSIAQVMQPGYRVGDKVLRAATVGVVDPASAVPVDTSSDESADAPVDES